MGQGQQTTGQARLGEHYIGEITSGRDGLSDSVEERARQVGIETRRSLGNHVEMKLADLMVQRGTRTGEVVVNNAPCGWEPGALPGCHQFLDRFLPAGSSMTVHGTDADGQHVSQTYYGKAQR